MVMLALLVLMAGPELGAGVALPELPPLAPAHSVVVPILEAALVDFGLATFNNLGSQQAWAQISLASFRANLQPSAWTFDNDYFVTNQFGHPYQGSMSFIAARSSGLSFWWSTLFPLMASLVWELFSETEAPDVNDQITTSLAGVFLGESLYRVSLLVLESDLPGWAREGFSFLLAPMASINRWLFEGRFASTDVRPHTWYRGWIGGGGFGQIPVDAGAYIAANVTYGSPFEHAAAPFSHFDLRASLSLSALQQVTGDIDIRGLLKGWPYGGGQLHGNLGFFGGYEYVAPRIFRASSVNLGVGTLAQWNFTGDTALEASVVISGIPFGAGGQVQATPADGERDYHIGPGVHLEGELSLVNEKLGLISVGARRWNFFGGLYSPPAGFDIITYFSARVQVRIGRSVLAGAEFVHAQRDATFNGVARHQHVNQLRLVVGWLFTDGLGVVPDARPPPMP